MADMCFSDWKFGHHLTLLIVIVVINFLKVQNRRANFN